MADPISLADAGSSFNVNQLSVFRIIFIREKATEEFFWNVWNAIHNCSFGKCCRNQDEARAEKMRQMDCATHLTRLADSMQKRATHVPAHPAGHSCGGPCIYIGKKQQRNSFGMCGTQSIIAAMENAAGIMNEARAERMRQMDCATHLRRLADSFVQASQIGKKRQRNSLEMCGPQSIFAAMENAAGIKNEARLEKMRQMDC